MPDSGIGFGARDTDRLLEASTAQVRRSNMPTEEDSGSPSWRRLRKVTAERWRPGTQVRRRAAPLRYGFLSV